MLYSGLSDNDVIYNRKKYGSNSITNTKKESLFNIFIETLGDPIIKILLIVLGIKIVFLIKDFDWYETIGIIIAIMIASFISTISEYGSQKAFIRLTEESSKIKCRVKRNNKIEEIDIDDVVVNDIVVLGTGDKIVADGILIDGNLSIDESMINGETKEVYKDINNNKLYRSTIVYEGQALMLVTSVGNNTMYGQMALELQDKVVDSPLKVRLTNLAKLLSKIGYICAILVFVSYLFSKFVIEKNFDINYIFEALTLSVTVIVVAVPEGLPMMITLVLSSNMRRMIKNNVLVRKLVGIETCGSLNILFTDKTGTLTKGKMDVVDIRLGNGVSFDNYMEMNKYNKYRDILVDSIIYNTEGVYDNNSVIGGNLTDRCLLEFVKTKCSDNIKIIDRLVFNSKNKYSSVIIEKNKIKEKYIKGAVELIINNCDYYYDEYGNRNILRNKESLIDSINQTTSLGIRAIALAKSKDSNLVNSLNNLTLIGIVYIKDEVREDAEDAINKIKSANIEIIMITGDSKNTAIAIGREVGLLNRDDDLVISHDELDSLSDSELQKKIPYIRIIYRALPNDKGRLVKVCQDMGLVVGMTGDGVNDAVALKKADVGFALGSGTDVAKDASDIVIMDDNLNSIGKAILYGRTIFKSIRKFIIFQLTVNLCAVSISIIGPFIGISTPVTVIQMLWINMVMDTLAALAFSYEPAKIEYMDELPKKKEENIINKYMLNEIIVTGIYSTILCVLFLKLDIISNLFRYSYDDIYLLTAFFGLFIFMSISNCFNARTHRLNLFSKIYKNKAFIIVILFIIVVQVYLIYFGGSLFRTKGLSLKEFIIMLIISFTVIPFDMLRKLYLKKRNMNTGV